MVDDTYNGQPVEGARQQLRNWAAAFGYDADNAIADFDAALKRGVSPDVALATVHLKHVYGY